MIIVFDRFGHQLVSFKNRPIPRIGETVYLDGRKYQAVEIIYFMEGNVGIKMYEELESPFVLISLLPL